MEIRDKINNFQVNLDYQKKQINNFLLNKSITEQLKSPLILLQNVIYKGKISFIKYRFENLRCLYEKDFIYRDYLIPSWSCLTSEDILKKYNNSLKKTIKKEKKLIKFMEKNR